LGKFVARLHEISQQHGDLFFQLADNERVLLAFGMKLRLQLVERVAGPAQGARATE
jgi:hypothetical protein